MTISWWLSFVEQIIYSLYNFKLVVMSMCILPDALSKFAQKPKLAVLIRTRAKMVYRHARTQLWDGIDVTVNLKSCGLYYCLNFISDMNMTIWTRSLHANEHKPPPTHGWPIAFVHQLRLAANHRVCGVVAEVAYACNDRTVFTCSCPKLNWDNNRFINCLHIRFLSFHRNLIHMLEYRFYDKD